MNFRWLFGFSCLLTTRFSSFFFFLVAALVDFLSVNSAFVHCSWTHKFHFLTTFSLKIGPTILFTHLKIILLQCFQFSVFSFSKISSIQTHTIVTLSHCFQFISPSPNRNSNSLFGWRGNIRK